MELGPVVHGGVQVLVGVAVRGLAGGDEEVGLEGGTVLHVAHRGPVQHLKVILTCNMETKFQVRRSMPTNKIVIVFDVCA